MTRHNSHRESPPLTRRGVLGAAAAALCVAGPTAALGAAPAGSPPMAGNPDQALIDLAAERPRLNRRLTELYERESALMDQLQPSLALWKGRYLEADEIGKALCKGNFPAPLANALAAFVMPEFERLKAEGRAEIAASGLDDVEAEIELVEDELGAIGDAIIAAEPTTPAGILVKLRWLAEVARKDECEGQVLLSATRALETLVAVGGRRA